MGQPSGPIDPRDPVVPSIVMTALCAAPDAEIAWSASFLGVPDTLLADEREALEVLAEAGMAPRLRLVRPIHRHQQPGVA